MSLSALTSNDSTYFARADQTEFLGTPEAEPHRVVDLRRTAQLQRGLQHRRHAGAVVVDARPLGDAVEMRPGHHHVAGRAGLGLRDHVAGRDGLGLRGEFTVAGPMVVRSGAPSDLVTLTTGILTSVFSPSVPPIFSSTTLSATIIATAPRSHGGLLLGERAGAAIHQHHRAVDRQAVVVGGIAARAVVAGTAPADRSPRRAGCARLYSNACASTFLPPMVTDPGLGVKDLRFELRGLHVKTLVPQLARDVVDAGVVARSPDRAGVVVGIGDVLTASSSAPSSRRC